MPETARTTGDTFCNKKKQFAFEIFCRFLIELKNK